MGLIDISVFLKLIPTTALIIGGILILYDGLNMGDEGKVTTGLLLVGLGALLQFYYLKKRYD